MSASESAYRPYMLYKLLELKNVYFDHQFDSGPADRRRAMRDSLGKVTAALVSLVESSDDPMIQAYSEHFWIYYNRAQFFIKNFDRPLRDSVERYVGKMRECEKEAYGPVARDYQVAVGQTLGNMWAALGDYPRARNPVAHIIVSTVHDEIWTLRKLLARDVNAIIYKTDDGSEILRAIYEILKGHNYYCEAVHDALRLAGDSSLYPTSRELEVLYQIAQGKTSREIAAAMFVSDNTIESHRKALFAKLGAVNVADLIVKAISRGYLKKSGVKR